MRTCCCSPDDLHDTLLAAEKWDSFLVKEDLTEDIYVQCRPEPTSTQHSDNAIALPANEPQDVYFQPADVDPARSPGSSMPSQRSSTRLFTHQPAFTFTQPCFHLHSPAADRLCDRPVCSTWSASGIDGLKALRTRVRRGRCNTPRA